MGNMESAGGWDDLVATFTASGLPVPPVPVALRPALERRGEWFWSTRPLDRGDLYDPHLLMDEATWPGPDYIAIARVGHGVNSHFLSCQAVFGPVALFAQTGWGGVYMDQERQAAEVTAQLERVARVLALADVWPEIARAGHRLIVAESVYKGINLCTWLELDGRPQPGLRSIQRSGGGDSALARAASRLQPSAPGDAAAANLVNVAVELEWEEIGQVRLQDGALAFPERLPKDPGLYRFRFVIAGMERVYVGEASDLQRRAGHYRIGHATGATNKRLHDAMLRHLAEGGTIAMALALGGVLTIGGDVQALDVRRKASRLLAEAAALHAIPQERLLNLPGIGDR